MSPGYGKLAEIGSIIQEQPLKSAQSHSSATGFIITTLVATAFHMRMSSSLYFGVLIKRKVYIREDVCIGCGLCRVYCQIFQKFVGEFAAHFDYDGEEILKHRFTKLFPLWLRPYGRLYAYGTKEYD